MKKLLTVAAVASILASCSQQKSSFTISADVKGIKDSTAVYLVKIDEANKPKKIDSSMVVKNAFAFKGTVDGIESCYVQLGERDGFIPYIQEEGDIKITFDKESPKDYKVEGTKNNNDFLKFNTELRVVTDEIEKFQQENTAKFMKAQEEKDKATMDALMLQMKEKQGKFKTVMETFVDANPSSFVSLVILSQLGSQLKEEDFITKFATLSEDVKNTKLGKKTQETIDKLKNVSVGSKAPDFTAKSPEGKDVSLYGSLGSKVTIIDFWASWCGPCRKENPNVVKLYNEYKDKGLNIIGVSLDDKEDAWKNAITKDGLTWTQVSNLKRFDDAISIKYAIKSIPSTFILDKDGKIVAKNLRGAELDAKIKELLK